MILIAGIILGGGALMLTILWWLSDLFPNLIPDFLASDAVHETIFLFALAITAGAGFALCALYALRWLDAKNKQRLTDLRRPPVRRARPDQVVTTTPLVPVPPATPIAEVPTDVEV
jgi:hypothetical protein